MKARILAAAFFAFLALQGLPAHAATVSPKLEIGGWIPYWRSATGTQDVLPHLKQLTTIHPFGFTMKKDGTLFDAAKITQEPWLSFISSAKASKVRVIPTVMWSDTDAMYSILSRQSTRIALEDQIANMVKAQGYDGIDIDFEGKSAETKNYFSTFLKGLYMRMGPKWVYCTIESRTPVSSRYDTPPPAGTIEYANDYVQINKYCDRVQIMAYDQGSIDLSLNRARAAPYVPVADPAWVEKVVDEALKTIPARKIILGVPTYGYEYEVTPLSEYGYRYDLQWAFNPKYATGIAAQYGVTPVRNSADELSFIYKPIVTPPVTTEEGAVNTSGAAPQTNNAPVASTVYSQAAIAAGITPPFNIMWWSDAQAIADKVAIAKRLGLRGVAVFKFDGGEDQGMWSILK